VRHVKVFVSSPRDVVEERILARQVVDRLGKDPAFRNDLKLDPNPLGRSRGAGAPIGPAHAAGIGESRALAPV
jgi:hypothetical protein